MASTQCERNEEEIAVQLSLEEKASLDEIMKQAVCSSESEELLNESLGVIAENEGLDKAAAAQLLNIVVVAGALLNQTKGPLRVVAKKIFEGYVVKGFPDPLSSVDGFLLSGKGVRAAVVYAVKNGAGAECGLLLAFADTSATGRRIYGECVPKDKYNKIDWKLVEQKLNNGGVIIKVDCKVNGTSLIAGIVGSGNTSAVAAVYLG